MTNYLSLSLIEKRMEHLEQDVEGGTAAVSATTSGLSEHLGTATETTNMEKVRLSVCHLSSVTPSSQTAFLVTSSLSALLPFLLMLRPLASKMGSRRLVLRWGSGKPWS